MSEIGDGPPLTRRARRQAAEEALRLTGQIAPIDEPIPEVQPAIVRPPVTPPYLPGFPPRAATPDRPPLPSILAPIPPSRFPSQWPSSQSTNQPPARPVAESGGAIRDSGGAIRDSGGAVLESGSLPSFAPQGHRPLSTGGPLYSPPPRSQTGGLSALPQSDAPTITEQPFPDKDARRQPEPSLDTDIRLVADGSATAVDDDVDSSSGAAGSSSGAAVDDDAALPPILGAIRRTRPVYPSAMAARRRALDASTTSGPGDSTPPATTRPPLRRRDRPPRALFGAEGSVSTPPDNGLAEPALDAPPIADSPAWAPPVGGAPPTAVPAETEAASAALAEPTPTWEKGQSVSPQPVEPADRHDDSSRSGEMPGGSPRSLPVRTPPSGGAFPGSKAAPSPPFIPRARIQASTAWLDELEEASFPSSPQGSTSASSSAASAASAASASAAPVTSFAQLRPVTVPSPGPHPAPQPVPLPPAHEPVRVPSELIPPLPGEAPDQAEPSASELNQTIRRSSWPRSQDGIWSSPEPSSLNPRFWAQEPGPLGQTPGPLGQTPGLRQMPIQRPFLLPSPPAFQPDSWPNSENAPPIHGSAAVGLNEFQPPSYSPAEPVAFEPPPAAPPAWTASTSLTEPVAFEPPPAAPPAWTASTSPAVQPEFGPPLPQAPAFSDAALPDAAESFAAAPAPDYSTDQEPQGWRPSYLATPPNEVSGVAPPAGGSPPFPKLEPVPEPREALAPAAESDHQLPTSDELFAPETASAEEAPYAEQPPLPFSDELPWADEPPARSDGDPLGGIGGLDDLDWDIPRSQTLQPNWAPAGWLAPPSVRGPLVPSSSIATARYRGRRGTQPGSIDDQTDATALVLMEESRPPTPFAVLLDDSSPAQLGEGSGLPVGTGAVPQEADQWHHKALSSLGFHKPRRSLSRRATALLIVGAVMALTALAFVILLLTGQIGSQSSTPPSLNESSPPTSAHPDWVIGQTFEDGDLAFRILSYEDSLPSLVADGGEVAERGQWVVIQLEISNPGETERTFVPDVQEIVTNQGEIYPNEPASALRIAEPALGAKPIAPGDKQVGYMAFDIPIEAKPTELKLTSRVGEPALVIPLG